MKVMKKRKLVLLVWKVVMCSCFFFQAEDGIRDADVTGVQTCALPILRSPSTDDGARKNIPPSHACQVLAVRRSLAHRTAFSSRHAIVIGPTPPGTGVRRSEERRVGKGCRAGGAAEN